jgi:hypothetical protein
MSQKHEALQLKRELEAKGYKIVKNGQGHWEVQDPRNGRRMTSFGNTPGGGRWKLNTIGDIRRYLRRCPGACRHVQPV